MGDKTGCSTSLGIYENMAAHHEQIPVHLVQARPTQTSEQERNTQTNHAPSNPSAFNTIMIHHNFHDRIIGLSGLDNHDYHLVHKQRPPTRPLSRTLGLGFGAVKGPAKGGR